MIKMNDDISHHTVASIRTFRATVITLVIAVMVAGCAGDGRVGETANAGAAIGAGIGFLVGAMRGRPAEGLIIGAGVGAAEGAYEGWRQEQDDDRTRELANAIRDRKPSGGDSGKDTSSRAREELTRFLGVWSIDGWTMDGDQRYDVHAKANGTVQMNNYAQLAIMDIQVKGKDVTIWGEAMLGYDDDVGYTYSSRINTLPEPFHATGQFDAVSRTFTFSSQGDKMVIRFDTPDRFALETFDGNRKIESYQFTRS